MIETTFKAILTDQLKAVNKKNMCVAYDKLSRMEQNSMISSMEQVQKEVKQDYLVIFGKLFGKSVKYTLNRKRKAPPKLKFLFFWFKNTKTQLIVDWKTG